MTVSTTAVVQAPQRPAPAHRVAFPNLLRAEALKLTTVRPTWVIVGLFLAAGVAGTVAFVVGFAFPVLPGSSAGEAGKAVADSVASGVAMAASMVLIPFGVLAVTSEFRTGQVQASLTSDPNRLRLMAAKTLAVVGATAAVSALAAAAGLGVGWLVAKPKASAMALEGPAWEVLVGVVVQATLIASFAYALGWLTRSSAVGVALSYLIFLAVPIVLTAASQSAEWVARLAQYAPDRIIYTVNAAEPSTLGGHWGGPAIMAGYVAVLLIAAALSFRRSDI